MLCIFNFDHICIDDMYINIIKDARYCDANWLPSRPSCFVGCRNDGVMEWWDLLISGGHNVMQMKVCFCYFII